MGRTATREAIITPPIKFPIKRQIRRLILYIFFKGWEFIVSTILPTKFFQFDANVDTSKNRVDAVHFFLKLIIDKEAKHLHIIAAD